MKKHIILVLFLIIFMPAVCYSKLHFGIISAVKEKVKELKNKVDEEEEKQGTFSSTSWVDADGNGQESINISNTSGLSHSPSLCLDGAGNPHIAWEENISGSYEIYYLKWDGLAWVDADGSGQESINISSNSGGSQSPSLSLDASGNPHIAWYDDTSGNIDIYYLKWNSTAWVDVDGNGQESINISNTSGWSRFQSLYLDGTGNPHIAWEENIYGSYDIYYLKWDGVFWVDADGSGKESINISNTIEQSRYPSLCLDETGNPHIAWYDYSPGNSEIYYLKWKGVSWVDADGSGQESIRISNNSGESRYPSLCLDGTGNPHIAWHDYTSGYSVYYLKWNSLSWVDADGSGQESINISNNMACDSAPSLYLDGTGNSHIAWDELCYLRWNDSSWVDSDGSGQESKKILNTSGSSCAQSFSLDASGNPHIAWEENTSGNSEIYYLKGSP